MDIITDIVLFCYVSDLQNFRLEYTHLHEMPLICNYYPVLNALFKYFVQTLCAFF